ncbi:toll-like receptor 2 type-2 [Pollicipes pollicipes]|uniref:toll-like receptor 2 type-2 n=1 Tax=Pollicipes pollicipes TaxID=41117 RepID=UPI0018859907|nr:toll-like receptor 2 type-2 [Pollicipes pollicipes]
MLLGVVLFLFVTSQNSSPVPLGNISTQVIDVDVNSTESPHNATGAFSSETQGSYLATPRLPPIGRRPWNGTLPKTVKLTLMPDTSSLSDDDLLELTMVKVVRVSPAPRSSRAFVSDCSYDPTMPASSTAALDGVESSEDRCQSCELDDDGLPLDDEQELAPGEKEDAAAEQIFIDGLDALLARQALHKALRVGLLDAGTFSAEERRRRPLADQAAALCKCLVNKDETTCSGKTSFCDTLPQTKVPSGILDVSETNISHLAAHSLEFFRAVSVLKLENNQLGSIDDGAFFNMSSLRNLSLSQNRLTDLGENVLKGASNLVELLVSYNKFNNLSMVTRATTAITAPSLLHLSIGGNNFSVVRRQDFAAMRNVPIQDLQLHENRIQHIEPYAFKDLKHLRRLRLRRNHLEIAEVVEMITAMQNSTLEVIDLSMIGKYSIVELRPVLDAIANSSITALQLNHYCFPFLFKIHFPALDKLKVLTLAQCGISVIYENTFEEFVSLEQLDLSDNYLSYVPSAVLLPNLHSLDLSRSEQLPYFSRFSLYQYRFRDMVNLRYLDLSNNRIVNLERGAFVGLENLTVLMMKNSEIRQVANFTFSMMENLSELYLSNNPLNNQVFEYTWQGLTKLAVLFLDNCTISTSDLYLRETPRLEILNMKNNFIQTLTHATFGHLRFLSAVDLSHNDLLPWEERVFDFPPNLTRVYLSHNSITHVTTAMVDDFQNLRLLKLGFNPYRCTCELYEWLLWEEANSPSYGVLYPVTSDIKDCVCDSPRVFRNISVLDFYSLSNKSPCAVEPSTRMLFTLLPVAVSGMLVAVGIRLLYRNRWYLRYWLFKLTSKRWVKKLRKDSSGYLYDAFVSYSSEDADFVLEMIENLEKISPYYRLCVYERDFEIGNVISECILESITTSRKTILILTDHFAKSHWCRWEMNLVQCRLFEQTRDDLILVKLGKIRRRHLTPTIRYLMRTRIYIEWGPSAQQQQLFWERLRTALRRPGGLPHLPRTV